MIEQPPKLKITQKTFVNANKPSVISKIKEINNLENIQILTRSENSKKGNRDCSEVSEEYYNLVKDLIKPEFQNKIKTNGKSKFDSLEKTEK